MEDILTTMARQFLPQTTREERPEALLSLKRPIDEVFFATDGAKACRKSLRALDVRRHDASASGEHAINRVNGLRSRIVEFIDGFRGVATRRVWNHLARFKWVWSFRRGRTAGQTASLVVEQVGASPYKTTWRNCKRTLYPFYDYRVKQAKWDPVARAALPLAMGPYPKWVNMSKPVYTGNAFCIDNDQWLDRCSGLKPLTG